jgi:hypothetical protein
MLKTYRIIPLVFILFLFGFTLFTESPVLAEDSSEFVACQQIKPRGDFRLMKQKKNCFRDVARSFQGQSGDSVQAVVPVESSGGEVAQLNARIVESQSQVATLTTTNAQLQEQLRSASAAAEPLNAKIAELNAENATLREQQGAPADPSGGISFDVMYDAPGLWRELRGNPCKVMSTSAVQICSLPLSKEITREYRQSIRRIPSCDSRLMK